MKRFDQLIGFSKGEQNFFIGMTILTTLLYMLSANWDAVMSLSIFSFMMARSFKYENAWRELSENHRNCKKKL